MYTLYSITSTKLSHMSLQSLCFANGRLAVFGYRLVEVQCLVFHNELVVVKLVWVMIECLNAVKAGGVLAKIDHHHLNKQHRFLSFLHIQCQTNSVVFAYLVSIFFIFFFNGHFCTFSVNQIQFFLVIYAHSKQTKKQTNQHTSTHHSHTYIHVNKHNQFHQAKFQRPSYLRKYRN